MNNMMLFENGKVICSDSQRDVDSALWNPHPSFRGVFMKNLISGSETEGRLSCHMVKIDPGCEIGTHMHDGRMELHEVVGGSGRCFAGDKVSVYCAGVVSCIPDNINHRVEAGDDGLFILAKFSPALI